jgi:hypothetical protein
MTRKLPQDVIDDLDPGVRKLVSLLFGAGFDTCDSGDGKTKFKDRPIHEHYEFSRPHVFIQCERDKFFTQIDGVQNFLERHGIDFSDPPAGASEEVLLAPRPGIEGNASPHQECCYIVVWHVTDDMLKEPR